MWYFDNLGAYKSAAHGNPAGVEKGHREMDYALDRIEAKADELRHPADAEKQAASPPQ